MRIAFVIPGDIELPTGGYAYDRQVMAELRRAGHTVDHVVLPGSFPNPSAADLATTAAALAALPAEAVLLIDGLAYGAFSTELLRGIRQPIVALVHHPLALEAGLAADRQQALHASEQQALTFARRIVVTSPTTARTLTDDFGVPAGRVRVAVPGTTPATRAHGAGQPLHVLAVGSIVPRKAYDVLVRALAHCRASNWRLSIVGVARSAEAEVALAAAIRETGLAERITIRGALGEAELDACYAGADLFVLPSLYEGFGMVLTEAMARGLPIVCTTGGAAAETVPDTAAIKVAPGDVRALATALDRAMTDPPLRQAMSDSAWDAAQQLQRWDKTARIVAIAALEAGRT